MAIGGGTLDSHEKSIRSEVWWALLPLVSTFSSAAQWLWAKNSTPAVGALHLGWSLQRESFWGLIPNYPPNGERFFIAYICSYTNGTFFYIFLIYIYICLI